MTWCKDDEWQEACKRASFYEFNTYKSVHPMLEYIVLKLEKIEAELEVIKKELK